MAAVSDYFRTALLIDDRVESDYTASEQPAIDLPDGISEEPASGLIAPIDDSSPVDGSVPVYPSDLVKAFLEAGIVCSIVSPTQNDDTVEMALRGAGIADILILDWVMFGDENVTLEAIKSIHNKHKDSLTVIVVFTGSPDLSEVTDRLMGDASFKSVAGDFMLRQSNTIVLVFGKPRVERSEDEKERTVEYGQLPKMIRRDLETMFKGLMPEFAFRGINVLRRSAPRILATFKSDLDAGALIHRALLPEPSDAGLHFIRLLVSDFEQALREQQVDDVWNADSVKQFLADTTLIADPTQLAQRVKNSEPIQFQDLDDRKLVVEAISSALIPTGIPNPSKALPDLIAVFEDAATSNETLATLMCSSDLGETPPRLELGIVLQDESGDYWLCIQPLCDSVRLQAARAFPMLPLKKKQTKGRFDHGVMIRDGTGDCIALELVKNPHELQTPKFDPKSEDSVLAVPAEDRDGRTGWQFKSVDDEAYRAIARLRLEIAVSAVQAFTAQAARVGVDNSEWLRLGGANA